MSELRKNVVVVGLSAAGTGLITALEKQLPPTHRIIGINREEYNYFTLPSLRASVLPGWEKHITVPLGGLAKKPETVLLLGTSVTDLSPTHVTVDKEHSDKGLSTKIPYDVLVLATGASYSFPARPLTGEITAEDARRRLRDWQGQIRKATSVLVVGGGAVGVEFAGEVAYAFPDKRVTLVHAHDRLHSSLFTPGFHDGLLKRLQDRNVEVILHTRAKLRPGVEGLVQKQAVELDNGSSIEADFVLNATGNKPNGALARSLSPDLVTADGYIKVKQTLQMDSEDSALSRVFAIGDCTKTRDIVEWKCAISAAAQAGQAAKNIMALLNNKPMGLFKKQPIWGLVAMGPEDGLMQLPFGGFMLGGWAAKRVKSAKQFVPIVWSGVNAEYENDFPNERPS